MKNSNLSVFNKGNYQNINNDFMVEGIEALTEIDRLQEKYNKLDTDTFLNELRDQITGYYLGFKMINIDKHGFDCKKDKITNLFLEVKSISFSAKSWAGTFNDTTMEKANAFKDKKLYIALSVWKNASDLLFICFGQNEKVGEYIEKGVKNFLAGKTVRSSQTISLSSFINKYGFKICPVDKSVDDIKKIMSLKSRSFARLPNSVFINKSEINKYIK